VPVGSVNLDRQGSTWTQESGTTLILSAYTGTWTTTPPGAPQRGFWLADGYNGAISIEIVENNVGAATVQIEGSFDGVNWYGVGYQRIDGQATLTRAAGAFAVVQNNKYVLQVLDSYPLMRVRPSANAGSLTVHVYMEPV